MGALKANSRPEVSSDGTSVSCSQTSELELTLSPKLSSGCNLGGVCPLSISLKTWYLARLQRSPRQVGRVCRQCRIDQTKPSIMRVFMDSATIISKKARPDEDPES